MTDFRLGVLGLGYLGQWLYKRYSWGSGSFGAGHGSKPASFIGDWVGFDWAQPKTWEALPLKADGLVLTIPPILEDLAQEKCRVQEWGDWMSRHRPGLKRLVYISSTGVFPNQPGFYDETTPPQPDSPKGCLRWATEQALGPYFDLTVIRPAAIYGPGRGIAQRLRQGLPIPADSGRIHRIEVRDLAAICRLALTTPCPSPLHALDEEPAESLELALWLLKQPNWAGVKMVTEPGFLARSGYASAPGRVIGASRLKSIGFNLEFPNYRAALAKEEP
ncbi:MAG: hypothetical protein A2527_07410 [Candidatus Lambdaproteobacteria bacterium RIFOXYD2_FULL_50_16]|uniref:NAD-dependent epimerase/dehydratase domain-containing protein n=1 Tax=Candidatus Lambdaproteobacteria bacterium RIFOXYD2_FULL_50_16 TaxID=1817772 RepID=A0A1F6GB65_9PROT|nr:MAG: hypothetical protein A2527_07410 [Candidatus Lambdaproteobacteria bacterium RIFOXYD2_FULL_50_16]